MTKIICLKGVACAGKNLVVGKKYDISSKDAKYLTIKGKVIAEEDFVSDDEPGGLDAMGVKGLKAYAAENDIDLKGLKSKDDIRAAIDVAEAEKAEAEKSDDE